MKYKYSHEKHWRWRPNPRELLHRLTWAGVFFGFFTITKNNAFEFMSLIYIVWMFSWYVEAALSLVDVIKLNREIDKEDDKNE
jgi:hypothetical protein